MTTLQGATLGSLASPANAPRAFHLLAKPSRSTRSIDCTYCFFPSKAQFIPTVERATEGTFKIANLVPRGRPGSFGGDLAPRSLER